MNRTSVIKKPEKSPVLSTRKSNSNSINSALKTNQNQSQLHEPQQNRKSLGTQSKSPPPPPPSLARPPAQHYHQHPQQPHPQQPPNNHSNITPDNASAVSSDDDSDHINVDKLKTIHNKAAHK